MEHKKRQVYKRRRLQFPLRFRQTWKKYALILSHSRAADEKTMGGILRKASLPEGTVHLEKKKRFQKPCKDYVKGTCTNPSCDPGASSLCARITDHKQAEILARSVRSYTEEQIARRKKNKRGSKRFINLHKEIQRVGWRNSGRCVADDQFNITEGSKILETQSATSVFGRRITFYETSGQTRTIAGCCNPTSAFS